MRCVSSSSAKARRFSRGGLDRFRPRLDGSLSERVPQRELNQPRRAYRRKYPAEWAAWRSRDFHVVYRWIRKVRVIPDIEEVGGKPQVLLFGDLEILDQREIPVLLVRSAVNVAAKISKESYYAVAPLGSGHERRGREIRRVQVAVVHPVLDASARQSCGKRSSRRELPAQCRRCQPGTEERRPCPGIRHRKRRA